MSTRNATYDDLAKFIANLEFSGFQIDQKWLFNQFGLNYNEEKEKIAEEEVNKVNYICPRCREAENICDCKGYYDREYMEQKVKNQVLEAMEKGKFVNGKTTYSGNISRNQVLEDFYIMHGIFGVDYGKEKSKTVVQTFTTNDWTNHPIYLELKNNVDVKCEIDNKGHITGTVVSNLYRSKQWFFDFTKKCSPLEGVLNFLYSQNPYQGLLNFEIQLIECFTETKSIPKMIYEVGSNKPFYEQYAICNQCDKPDIYKPKTENYTCQKCWPR